MRQYINPRASGKRLIYMAHSSVVIYAILLASFSTGLYYIGISMGYLYLLMGVIISSAVLPATLSLMWADQNLPAVVFSPILGLACSLVAWLVTAKTQLGELTVESTGSNYPMLAGNVVALLSPCVFIPVLTFAFGRQKYDWQSMLKIRLGDDSDLAASAGTDLESIPGRTMGLSQEETAKEQAKLKRAGRIAGGMTIFMTVAMLVLWPMPMFGSSYVFSKPFFTGWVVVGIMWIFFSLGCVGIYPLWEGRRSLAHTFKSIVKELSGGGPPPKRGSVASAVLEGKETGTPVEESTEEVKTKALD